MFNKAFPAVPRGNVRVETPDGVTRTYGDDQRNNLTDASWVSGSSGFAFGAFPNEDDSMFGCPDCNQPTMRKPVNE